MANILINRATRIGIAAPIFGVQTNKAAGKNVMGQTITCQPKEFGPKDMIIDRFVDLDIAQLKA